MFRDGCISHNPRFRVAIRGLNIAGHFASVLSGVMSEFIGGEVLSEV